MKPFATMIGALGWIADNACGPCSVLLTVPPKTFRGKWTTKAITYRTYCMTRRILEHGYSNDTPRLKPDGTLTTE